MKVAAIETVRLDEFPNLLGMIRIPPGPGLGLRLAPDVLKRSGAARDSENAYAPRAASSAGS